VLGRVSSYPDANETLVKSVTWK